MLRYAMAPSHDPEFHDDFNLGSFSRPVATKHKPSAASMAAWHGAYGSNHTEATNLFRFCHFLRSQLRYRLLGVASAWLSNTLASVRVLLLTTRKHFVSEDFDDCC